MTRVLAVLCLVLVGLGCSSESKTEKKKEEERRASVAYGRELVRRYECASCHSQALFETTTNCAVCHKAIRYAAEGGPLEYVASEADQLEDRVVEWNRNITHFRHLPSFVGVTRLLRADWIERFLVAPHDLRPRLDETMPHLGLSADEARNVVAFLATLDGVATTSTPFFTDQGIADYTKPHPPLEAGDVRRGARLFETRGCGSCHAFTGARPPPPPTAGKLDRGVALAPDLRFTRDRFVPEMLVPWLLDPTYYKHDAAMPQVELSYQEARDVAAFVMTTPLGAAPRTTKPERLPVLRRPVRYAEVEEKVFGKICVHCHSDPSAERGNGGPGYAGGFGFPARKLDLSDYESIFAGAADESGKRHSIFAPTADGKPRVVAALWARWDEVTGGSAELRGMPLALPPLSPSQIQLVESWIAQGRRR